MLLTLLIVFISLIVLVIFLLSVPIDIRFEFNNKNKTKTKTHITWLYGLVDVDLEGQASKTVEKIHISKKVKRKKKKPKRSFKTSWKAFLAVIKTEGFAKKVFQLLKGLLHVAEIKQLQGEIAFALDDPADTGRLYGMMSPAFAFMYALPRINFAVTPLFAEPTIKAELKFAFRLVPVRIFVAIFRFIFSKESFLAMRNGIKAGK